MNALQTAIDAIALGSIYALVAMGLSLVFGVMRLVNFAQGELLTAGGYSLVLTIGWPVAPRILVLFAVVIAFALATQFALRPLRGASPAALLVTTFAFSFLLQSIALLVFGPLGDNARFLPELNRAVEIGDLRVRWVTIASIGVGAILLTATTLFLGRTSTGLADARRRSRLSHGADSRRAGEPRRHDRVPDRRRADRGPRPCSSSSRAAARDALVRLPARHTRPRGCRGRRHGQARHRHARRLCSRCHHGRTGRCAAEQPPGCS